jgi:hypothetical protein
MFGKFGVRAWITLAAVVVFVLAFIVSMGWAFHNWQAWVSAGFAVLAAAWLPWRDEPRL